MGGAGEVLLGLPSVPFQPPDSAPPEFPTWSGIQKAQVSGRDSLGGRGLTVWGPDDVCEKRRSGLEMPARLCRAGLFRNCAVTEPCVQNTRPPAACQLPCLGVGKRGSGGAALPPPRGLLSPAGSSNSGTACLWPLHGSGWIMTNQP